MNHESRITGPRTPDAMPDPDCHQTTRTNSVRVIPPSGCEAILRARVDALEYMWQGPDRVRAVFETPVRVRDASESFVGMDSMCTHCARTESGRPLTESALHGHVAAHPLQSIDDRVGDQLL